VYLLQDKGVLIAIFILIYQLIVEAKN